MLNMKFRKCPKAGNSRDQAGFTLAEVVAAMLFMAIVIPVAIGALRIAGAAGEVSMRKAVAIRVANRVLEEVVVTGQMAANTQNGVVEDGAVEYRWSLRSQPWQGDVQYPMTMLTVQVTFPIQGQDQNIRVSTLVGLASK